MWGTRWSRDENIIFFLKIINYYNVILWRNFWLSRDTFAADLNLRVRRTDTSVPVFKNFVNGRLLHQIEEKLTRCRGKYRSGRNERVRLNGRFVAARGTKNVGDRFWSKSFTIGKRRWTMSTGPFCPYIFGRYQRHTENLKQQLKIGPYKVSTSSQVQA